MSTNSNNLTERPSDPAVRNNLANDYAASHGQRQSIEEYFGPGGTFWTLPITSDGYYIFDDIVTTTGKGNSNMGDADATDASMDISMSDKTNSSTNIANGTGETATSKTSTSDPEDIKDEDLFRAFLVSDLDDSSNISTRIATRHASPEHQTSTSQQSTRDATPTSTRPSTTQQIDTSSPLSDYQEVEEYPQITSSPPAAPPQKRSSRSSKVSKPSHVQRRTTRSTKGAETLKRGLGEEDVHAEQPKLVPVVDAGEGESDVKSLAVRKRQQPKLKSEVSEVHKGKASKSLAMRKRQQPQRAVKGKK